MGLAGGVVEGEVAGDYLPDAGRPVAGSLISTSCSGADLSGNASRLGTPTGLRQGAFAPLLRILVLNRVCVQYQRHSRDNEVGSR